MPSSLSFFFHSSVGEKKIKIKKWGIQGGWGKRRNCISRHVFFFFQIVFFFPFFSPARSKTIVPR